MLNDTLLNIGVTAMQTAAAYLSLHSATPNGSGSNETTATRVAASWGTATNGDFATLTNKAWTGGAAGGPVAAVGFWSAPTGGTFYGYQPIGSGDVTFNQAGEFSVTSLSIVGTAS